MTARFSFLLLLVVLFIVTLISAQNATSMSTGEGAEGNILKMYYGLSAFPIKDAKASFRNASSNDKSELWRTHLALFLVKRPELNERQKKVISAAMSLATSEFFEMRPSDPAWKAKVREPLRSLEEQIANAFSRKLAAKIFATLGDNTESANCGATYAGSVLLKNIKYGPLSNFSPYKPLIDNQFGGQDQDKDNNRDKGKDSDKSKNNNKGKDSDKDKDGDGVKMIGRGVPCECSTDSDWCPISSYCSGTNCTPTQSGCGTLWSYPCNGASCQR